MHENEYSKLSFMGMMMLSFAIIFFVIKLGKNENPDFLLFKFSGIFLFTAGILTILLVLTYACIFKRLMSDVINFSFGLLSIGISLMIIRPNSYSDEEINNFIRQGQEKKVIKLLFQSTPLFKKIIWIASAIAGVVIGEVYQPGSALSVFLFKETAG